MIGGCLRKYMSSGGEGVDHGTTITKARRKFIGNYSPILTSYGRLLHPYTKIPDVVAKP